MDRNETKKPSSEPLSVAGNLSAVCEALLVETEPGGQRRGGALGCRLLTVGGKTQPLATPDFEFEVRAGRVANAVPMTLPRSFRWQETEGGPAPAYD